MGRFFANDLHDEFGGWLLGYTASGGPDVGVLQAVGAAVGGGDDGAYHAAWMAAGDRLLAEADERPGAGESRCRLTLWAAACYATSYHPLYGSPVDPRLAAAFRQADRRLRRGRSRSCRTRSAPLRIPFEGDDAARLPAAGRRARGRRVRPLVILTNGYDATVTEMYFAAPWRSRGAGFHCLFFDGPGPGRAADRAGHAHAARLGGGDPRRRRLRARRCPGVDPRPHRPLGLEPRRLPGAARRQRRAAARRLHRRPGPARGDAAGDARRASGVDRRRDPGPALEAGLERPEASPRMHWALVAARPLGARGEELRRPTRRRPWR